MSDKIKVEELSRTEKHDFLNSQGWYMYYNPNYYVHPKTIKDKSIQDFTNYGMPVDDAYIYEIENMPPFDPQPDVISILKNIHRLRA